jgi:hypothetical protein
MVGAAGVAQKLTVLGTLAHFRMLEFIFQPFMAKNQNTSTKFQINPKFEISMTETNCSNSRIDGLNNVCIQYHILCLRFEFLVIGYYL